MTEQTYLGDKLLDVWLNLTSTLWNTRLVNGMTYNEAHVLGILLRHSTEHTPMTATDLIHRTRLLKSQMNKILTTLETQGYITRTRSENDERSLNITLTETGMSVAESMYERHRVLTRMLMELGVDEHTAREDACKLEHDLSEQSFQALCSLEERLLGK